MKDTVSVSVQIGGRTLTIETGLLARQAAGSTTVTFADAIVFAAVTNTDKPREGIDFFPLQVEYREKYYAAGRFPGGFFKRESRPSEKEILTARITDRPLRPLFPDGYYNDVQVNSMVLSADGENDPDVLNVVAASTALHISEIPFMGPIGAVRVGRIKGQLVINPTFTQRKESDLDLIYAGTRERFLMMEGAADEISEADFFAAMKIAHAEVVKLVDAQIELRRKLGKPDKKIVDQEPDAEKMAFLRTTAGEELRQALLVAGKQDREGKLKAIKVLLHDKIFEKWPELEENHFGKLFDALEIELVRRNLVEHGKRIDGRAMDVIRPLYAQLAVLPRAHGSAIFNRGETQSLGSVTLGTKQDVQSLDAITGGDTEKNFMLHYNFPPYSVGEVGRLGSTGRREIGHGALAELSPFAPRIFKIQIPVDKIGELIGPGGKNIRRITELSNAQIDIEDDGTVSIFAANAEALELAKREVQMITADPEEGRLYEGTVTGIKEFGCFVEILPGRDGLCHISELAEARIRSVEDVCKLGDKMWVKCIGVDDRGRVKLSRREAMRDLDQQQAAGGQPAEQSAQ